MSTPASSMRPSAP